MIQVLAYVNKAYDIHLSLTVVSLKDEKYFPIK